MTIDQIRYFHKVYEDRSFTLASQHLHMNQSTLSRQIAELEKEMGAILFWRNAKGLELTDAGKVFYDQSLHILETYQNMRDSIMQIGCGKSGRLSVGMPVNLLSYYAKLNCFDFGASYDNADFKYELMNLEELNAAILHNTIDVGFTYSFAIEEIRDDIISKYLFDEPFVFFASNSHPLTQQEQVTVEELAAQRHYLLRSDVNPSFVSYVVFRAREKGNERLSYVKNYENMFLSVATSDGIGCLPQGLFHAMRDVYGLSEIRLSGLDLKVQYVLMHNKKNKNPLINSFYKYCIQYGLF